MKTLSLLASAFLAVHANGQVLLNDQFSTSSVDPSHWTSSTPFSDSSATVSGGLLSLANGAGILSSSDFAGPIEVAFSFAFTGSPHDSLRVFTRSDVFYPNGYALQHGVGVSFRIQDDTGNLVGNIALEDSTGTLVSETVALTLGTFYSGRLVDTGSSLDFFMDDDSAPLLSAFTSEHYGSKVGVFNREGAGNFSFISAGSVSTFDYITVSAIPEPATYGAVLGIACLIGCLLARKKRPNQALQPTPMLVTPRADARVAPSTGVADL